LIVRMRQRVGLLRQMYRPRRIGPTEKSWYEGVPEGRFRWGSRARFGCGGEGL